MSHAALNQLLHRNGAVRPRSPNGMDRRRSPQYPSVERGAGPSKEPQPMPRHSKDTVATLGIDIGKNTFHLVDLNKRGPSLKACTGCEWRCSLDGICARR